LKRGLNQEPPIRLPSREALGRKLLRISVAEFRMSRCKIVASIGSPNKHCAPSSGSTSVHSLEYVSTTSGSKTGYRNSPLAPFG
jgi:hypothetical protein